MRNSSDLKRESKLNSSNLMHDIPVVLIMLLGVVEAAATALGVLPAVSPAEVLLLLLLLPTALTARLPGDVFFTGTTTLLKDTQSQYASSTHAQY